MAEDFLKGWNHEFELTYRVLARLPKDEWNWAPHSKSMPVGKVAIHLVEIERWTVRAMETEDFANTGERPVIKGLEGLLELAEAVHAEAVETIAGFSDAKMLREVPYIAHGREVMRAPVIGYLETMLKGHVIHHRGQLTVYLRLLGVSVPSLYGPSADEGLPEG